MVLNDEISYAYHALPILKQQLETYTHCKKQIAQENIPAQTLLLDIIGMTELKLALAKAIIAKAAMEEFGEVDEAGSEAGSEVGSGSRQN